jgi:hypothetical protein
MGSPYQAKVFSVSSWRISCKFYWLKPPFKYNIHFAHKINGLHGKPNAEIKAVEKTAMLRGHTLIIA